MEIYTGGVGTATKICDQSHQTAEMLLLPKTVVCRSMLCSGRLIEAQPTVKSWSKVKLTWTDVVHSYTVYKSSGNDRQGTHKSIAACRQLGSERGARRRNKSIEGVLEACPFVLRNTIWLPDLI
jgi:hypothetical protein